MLFVSKMLSLRRAADCGVNCTDTSHTVPGDEALIARTRGLGKVRSINRAVGKDQGEVAEVGHGRGLRSAGRANVGVRKGQSGACDVHFHNMVCAEVRDEDVAGGIDGDPIVSEEGLARHLQHRGHPRRRDFDDAVVSRVGDVEVAEGVHRQSLGRA